VAGSASSPRREAGGVPASVLVGAGAAAGAGVARCRAPRGLSPPADELNTPATFTPTGGCSYTCGAAGHFVFDTDAAVGVADFALTAVDDLTPNLGQLTPSFFPGRGVHPPSAPGNNFRPPFPSLPHATCGRLS